MGVQNAMCFFIVVEQIVFSNVQIINTYESFLNYGTFNIKYTSGWIKLFAGVSQIFVATILAQGLVKKKSSKFLPWLFVNAGYCLVLGVLGVIAIFDSKVFYEIFDVNNNVVKIGFFFFLACQWIIWLVVLLYYKRLKLKELKNKSALKRTKNKTPKNNGENETSQKDQIYKDKEKETALSLNRLYPQLPSSSNV